jgi:rare lipoprotein A
LISKIPYPALAALCLALIGCETLPKSKTPKPEVQIYASKPASVEEGIASWYGGYWIGRLTASGERYAQGDFTAAHKTLPFNSRARVINLKTGQSVIVRINNRGPYIKGRIIDLSVAAAKSLGTYEGGLARVRVEALREIPMMTSPNLRVKPRPIPPVKKSDSD